jgi:hypothetical protein
MFVVPVHAFLYGMEMLLDRMRSMQTIGDRSMRTMLGADGKPPPPAAPQVAQPTPSAAPLPQLLFAQPEMSMQPKPASPPQSAPPPTDLVAGAAPSVEHSEIKKETRKMDRDLQDDDLKLVRYKVLFLKRDHEHAFAEKEELVYDNITPESFTAWKIGEFIQSLRKGPVKISGKLTKYKKEHIESKDGEYLLKDLDEEDKKYLRVYYEVLERYPREQLRYEEEHLDVLREIKNEVSKLAGK